MEPGSLAILLFAISLAMFAAEVMLPSHGLLGIAGAGTMIACVVVCFGINQYIGLAVTLGTAIATPFALWFAMKIWPRTPIGRRMVLQPVESRLRPPLVQIGAAGVAISELKPMGTCEFAGERLEARSQLGIIPAGAKVTVVNIDAGRLIVRAAATVI